MATAAVTRVFISYSRKDAAFVARLKEALQVKGYDAFVDTEDISGGEQWKKRLDELILNADAVAFVVSPDSVASTVCDWETKRELELGKRLIPLLWRPLAGEPLPPQLAERNFIFFDNAERFESALTQLCNACDVDIGWVREHTRLVDLATRWDADGRRRDGLLRGADLAASKTWAAARAPRAPEIPPVFEDFVAASDLDERRARANRGRVIAVLSMLALLLLAGGGAFVTQDKWRPVLDAYLHYQRFAHSAADLNAARADATFRDCDPTDHPARCPEMVVLPAGQFMMGSADDDQQGLPGERPMHAVSIMRFAMSKYDVTFDDWQACVDDGGCGPIDTDSGWGRGNRPAIDISWNDAQQYVHWLSRKTGKTYRLPSEAEWEYAARGQTSLQAPHTHFPWGDELPVCSANAPNGAAFSDCPVAETYPVGSFSPNRFGLYDMVGNVWQWVEDCSQDYDPRNNTGAAVEPSDCPVRVVRGGSYNYDPSMLRVAARVPMVPTVRYVFSGFRVARTL